MTGSEMPGRTLGIVGLGTAAASCRLVAPFAMHCSPIRRTPNPPAQAFGVRLTTLEEVLRNRIRQPPLPAETGHAASHRAEQLARMKPSAYLINIGRGELVDQPALVEALSQRRIAGADWTFEHEPVPPGDPLPGLDNVILTPHWLASTADVWRATGRATAKGMIRAREAWWPTTSSTRRCSTGRDSGPSLRGSSRTGRAPLIVRASGVRPPPPGPRLRPSTRPGSR